MNFRNLINAPYIRIKVVFLSAILVLLVLSILSYVRIKRLINSSEWVNHSTIVKLELEYTLSSLTNMESAQRGFILSGDSSFLTDFNLTGNDIVLHLNNLDSLTRDNQTQQENITALRTLIKKRSAYLNALFTDSRNPEISSKAWSTGKSLMDDVRKGVTKIADEEDKLIVLRISSLDKETFLTPFFSVFLMISSVLVAISAYYKITRDLKASGILKSSLEQNNEELIKANKELESFNYISSHDLQEPLRKIQVFTTRIAETEYSGLSEKGKNYFDRIENAANRMQMLIQDLLAYSRTSTSNREFEIINIENVVNEIKSDLMEELDEKQATIETKELGEARIIPFQFRQLLYNLVSNAIKFSRPGIPPHIIIRSEIVNYKAGHNENQQLQKAYCHITFSDNGIGFDPKYKNRIFEVFQRLHGKDEYAGTGIGLAIVKKIVENHNGFITASGDLNKGTSFDIYIPAS